MIPSLEILGGKLVRLVGGAHDDPVVLDSDPLRAARAMRRAGAAFFHVVDLDAVFQQGDNLGVLAELAGDMIPFQVRGSIETVARAKELLRLGADRIVLGSLPFTDGKAALDLVERFGPRIAGTMDVQHGEVLVREGSVETGIEIDDAMHLLRAAGIQHVVYNSVEFAGEDAALDHDLIQAVLATRAFQLYVRCTVQAHEELDPLFALEAEGLLGFVLNHALAADTICFQQVAELV